MELPKALLRSNSREIYRVDAFTDGTIQVFVHRGEVEVESDAGTLWVKAGKLFNLRQGSQLEMTNLPESDDFDLWSGNRDGTPLKYCMSFVNSYRRRLSGFTLTLIPMDHGYM